jgi:hypothetical protein
MGTYKWAYANDGTLLHEIGMLPDGTFTTHADILAIWCGRR